MADLEREIRRLAGKIRAVEEMLVGVYGLTPITSAVAADLGSVWVHKLQALYRRIHRQLASLTQSSDIFRRACLPSRLRLLRTDLSDGV